MKRVKKPLKAVITWCIIKGLQKEFRIGSLTDLTEFDEYIREQKVDIDPGIDLVFDPCSKGGVPIFRLFTSGFRGTSFGQFREALLKKKIPE